MKHCLCWWQLGQQGVQFAVVDQIHKPALGNVLPLALRAQVVHQQQVGASAGVEVCHDGRAGSGTGLSEKAE